MTSLQGILLAVAATVVTSSPATAYDFSAGKQDMDREIGMCVAEVGKRANYDDAKRVRHWVVEMRRKNLAEQEIRIETYVYAADDEATSRQYASTCVTRGPLEVVSFDIEETDDLDYVAGL